MEAKLRQRTHKSIGQLALLTAETLGTFVGSTCSLLQQGQLPTSNSDDPDGSPVLVSAKYLESEFVAAVLVIAMRIRGEEILSQLSNNDVFSIGRDEIFTCPPPIV